MLVSLSVITPYTWAQGILHLYGLNGDLTFDFGLFRSQNENFQDSQQYTIQEKLRIKESGYVLHPGILNFTVELTPSFEQQSFKVGNVDSDSNARFLGYFIAIGILQARPASLNVRASRNTGTNTSSLGNQLEFETDLFAVDGTYSNFYFPLVINYSKRFSEQTETSGFSSAVFTSEEVEESISFSGNNSRIRLSLAHFDFEDKKANRGLISDSASFSHNLLRWGKGSSLKYNIGYGNREASRSSLNRKGSRSSRRLDFREQLHLQHTKNLFTTYSHTYSSQDQEVDTKKNSGLFALNHRLYRNLFTNLTFAGSSTESDSVRQLNYGGGLNLTYSKQLPWKGSFTASAGGDYSINENETAGALFEVVDEEHKVNSTLVFFLKRRFIVIDSVVITNQDETVVYINGQDYDIVSAGSLTEIRILTGGRINEGDTLIVDYVYKSLPSRKLSTTSFNYSTAISFRWVSLYYRLSRSDQDLLSGSSETQLISTENTTAGMEFIFDGPAYRLNLTAEKQSRRTDDTKTDTINLNQSYRHAFSRKIALSFNANQTFFDIENRDSTTFKEKLSINWRLKPNLLIDIEAELWQREVREEGDKSEEQFWKVGAKLRYFVGRIEIDSEYFHTQWGGASGGRDTDTFRFTLIRRF